jgi:hypothetical protein
MGEELLAFQSTTEYLINIQFLPSHFHTSAGTILATPHDVHFYAYA